MKHTRITMVVCHIIWGFWYKVGSHIKGSQQLMKKVFCFNSAGMFLLIFFPVIYHALIRLIKHLNSTSIVKKKPQKPIVS